jgi:hypothetical protein
MRHEYIDKNRLAEEFGGKVNRLAHRMIFDNDAAEEAAQEAWVEIIRRRGRGTGITMIRLIRVYEVDGEGGENIPFPFCFSLFRLPDGYIFRGENVSSVVLFQRNTS